MRKWIPLTAAALLMMSCLTGCFGRDDNANSESGTSQSSTEHTDTEAAHTEKMTERSTEGAANEVLTDAGDVVDGAVTEAGDAVEDIVTGAEDIIDDITPNGNGTAAHTETTTR
ncbi:MAG: hypothetical protein IJ496_07320 [Ruminococcus sp.]|nr:hypothetical protein [Ruminococcus sp.]